MKRSVVVVGSESLLCASSTVFVLSSGKREAGRKGSKVSGSQGEMTEQKSPPVDTGSSSLSDECANSAIAKVNEPV
ncbi:hypothetical protein T03_14411 [Trichinella britovi]|uniref:Uncharacterized protein n=1 Tax=Trichinella britovi TaxID=45882 RepID=A0A0V1D5J0_TRIBR|nr:hypothetical protein T03_14411 [Trichinella britovi]